MEEKYESICSQCCTIAEELDFPALKGIIGSAESFLERDTQVLTFVELSGLFSKLSMIAAYLCGKDVLKEYIEIFQRWDNWSVSLRYGEEEEWYTGRVEPQFRIEPEQFQDQKNQMLILTFPAEILKGKEIQLLCAGNRSQACTPETAASQQLYLITDATMAMTEAQMNWIKDFVYPCYDFERLYVCLMGTEYLNREEEKQQVIEYIERCLEAYGKASILMSKEDILEHVTSAGQDSARLMEASRRRIVKNMLAEFSQVMEKSVRRYNAKEEDFAHVRQQLEQQRALLVSSGRLTAENVMDNQIRKVIDAVEDSAEEYSDSMCSSIQEKVRTAKDIEEVENKISPYMERSWNYFAKQTSVQIAKDFDKINATLTQRMEEDIGDMLQQLDMPARELLGQFVMGEPGDYASEGFYQEADKTAMEAVSRNMRNMMILTIPLLFVAPTLSIAALLGEGIYFRLGKKQEEANYRKELCIHVERECSKAKKMAVNSFRQALGQEKEKMKNLVQQGYRQLVDVIEEELERQKADVAEDGKKAVRMEEILDKELPQMLRDL